MTWIVIGLVGLGSFILRVTPLFALATDRLPSASDRVIRHAGVAAIAALVATSSSNAAHGHLIVPVVVAVAAGVALAWRGTSMIRIVIAGCTLYGASLALVSAL
jgi:branched-subunit amino acid transport protein